VLASQAAAGQPAAGPEPDGAAACDGRRYLRGLAPKNTTWLVDGTAVGTEALFSKSAVFN
jgi:hypothetical protein